jgi:hypothetical protein
MVVACRAFPTGRYDEKGELELLNMAKRLGRDNGFWIRSSELLMERLESSLRVPQPLVLRKLRVDFRH